MVKRFSALFLALVLCFFSVACANGEGGEGEPSNGEPAGTDQDGVSDPADQKSGEGTLIEKDFGSYTVPAGWIEAEAYSDDSKTFYVVKGTENDKQPDNISVNIGENKYAKVEHLQFKDAIVKQLANQIANSPDTMLEGDGSTTDNGDILYTFTIDDEASGIVTTQYYVVGDHRFCLIHETNFTGDTAADEAAKSIANTFVWKD